MHRPTAGKAASSATQIQPASSWRIRSCVLGLVFFLLAAPVRAEWPVKRFSIFLGSPMESRYVGIEKAVRAADDFIDLDQEIAPPVPIPPSLISEIESYLAEIAKEMERAGFSPPVLEPLVEAPAGKAFRIYLYDFEVGSSSSSAKYKYDCAGLARRTIRFDVSTYIEAGKLTDRGYQDLAHELFHAVQQGYPLFREHCTLGDWIVEGTAQAVAADLAAHSSRRIDHPHRPGEWAVMRWGLRFYHRPLWVGDDDRARDDDGYGASSFWRYIGENVARQSGAGTTAVEPDYSYLADFFSTTLGGEPSQATEMKWIDERLKGDARIGLGLDRTYANFVTTFASYVNTRFKPKDRSPEDSEDKWLQIVFGGCPVIRLNRLLPLQRLELEIEPLAARCFRVDSGFPGAVDVAIHSLGLPASRIRFLALGTEQGKVVAKPRIIRSGMDYGFWLFPVGRTSANATGNPIFILSNVPDESEKRNAQLIVELTASGWESSMIADRKPPPPPPPPIRERRDSDDGVALPHQIERVGEKIEEGLHDLSANVAHGAEAKRRPEESPCREAFKFSACGPRTTIDLALLPGILGGMEYSTGRGGFFGQFAALLGGAGRDPAGSAAAVFEAAEKSATFDGAEVSISIPLIDYGFTGSFRNAALSVTRAGGGAYQAIGPEDAIPGPDVRFPLAGKVTIERYSPTVLRGSFEGALVDMSRVTIDSPDPVLPIHETISGRFTIVAPWRGDARVRKDLSENPEESVKKDLIEMFPGMESQIEAALERARASRPPSARDEPAVKTPLCDCSCNRMDKAAEQCDAICRSTWEACRGEKARSNE